MEGCISTPIPNYLSTLLYCSKKPKNTQNKVKNERKQCGNHTPPSNKSHQHGCGEGKKRGIETSFIDLPYSEILINCKEGKGLLKKENKSNYNDDYLFINELF